MRIRTLLPLLLVLGATAGSLAQEQDQPHPLELQQAALTAIARGEYDEGERLLRRQIEMQPDNFVAHYNLACALALQGETEPAVESLKSAIRHGFVDIHQLQNDPDLASVQDDPTVRTIIENWDRILEARIEANFESAKQQYSRGYTYEKDEALRLAYVSAFDQVSFAEARDEMGLIAAWAFEHVLTDLARPAQGDAAQTDPWVIVILPTREDFTAWQERLFGPQAALATSEVGGRYDHDSKRLIARDLGATLRHEFFHVLHWRDMMRLRQRHAIWIQEGLGCLVEDFDRQPDGTLLLTPSWRTNMAQRLASAGRLTDIEDLARMSHTQYLRSSKLARYAESRTFFLYLAAAGKLAEWYKTYTEHYSEDPTGVLATQMLFGEDMDAFQRQYEAWVKALPRVADMHEPGEAMLGIDIDPAGGEGLRVTSLVRRRDSGLRLGDIITAIDGRPTRDLNEMYRVLGDYRPGQRVTVRYRRHQVHGIAEVTLVAR